MRRFLLLIFLLASAGTAECAIQKHDDVLD